MSLWVMISDDEYELPEFVCDTALELSRLSGFSVCYIYNSASLYAKGLKPNSRFIKIDDTEVYND